MKTAAEIQAQVVEKATADEAFRSSLIENPRSAIESELNISIPESIRINVHEESLTEAHLVLPPGPRLTGEEIMQVAGGHHSLYGG